jgi:hypothetical protein
VPVPASLAISDDAYNLRDVMLKHDIDVFVGLGPRRERGIHWADNSLKLEAADGSQNAFRVAPGEFIERQLDARFLAYETGSRNAKFAPQDSSGQLSGLRNSYRSDLERRACWGCAKLGSIMLPYVYEPAGKAF